MTGTWWSAANFNINSDVNLNDNCICQKLIINLFLIRCLIKISNFIEQSEYNFLLFEKPHSTYVNGTFRVIWRAAKKLKGLTPPRLASSLALASRASNLSLRMPWMKAKSLNTFGYVFSLAHGQRRRQSVSNKNILIDAFIFALFCTSNFLLLTLNTDRKLI